MVDRRPSPLRIAGAVILWPLLELAIVVPGFLIGEAAGNAEAGVGVAVLLGFPLLGGLAIRLRRRSLGSAPDLRISRRAIGLGVLLGLVGLAAAVAASALDAALFSVPSIEEDYGLAAAALLLVGNGVVVPICEELYWRGYVLDLMLARWSAGLAVAANAIAFSLKHVMVDFSFGRLFTIVALGAVLALTYRRLGLAGSISAHIAANVAATVLFLAAA